VVPRAAVSYAVCVAEVAQQLRDRGLSPAAIYVSSSGSTGAGVALGKTLLGLTCPARLICPMPWPWHIPTALADDANTAAGLMGLQHRLTAADIDALIADVRAGKYPPGAVVVFIHTGGVPVIFAEPEKVLNRG
jgi:D-cysteine desulfhydrase/L-cysteate sulfo-lyase